VLFTRFTVGGQSLLSEAAPRQPFTRFTVGGQLWHAGNSPPWWYMPGTSLPLYASLTPPGRCTRLPPSRLVSACTHWWARVVTRWCELFPRCWRKEALRWGKRALLTSEIN